MGTRLKSKREGEWASEQRRRQMTFSFKCPFPLQMAVTVAVSCTFKILIGYRADRNGKCCGFQLQKTKNGKKNQSRIFCTCYYYTESYDKS